MSLTQFSIRQNVLINLSLVVVLVVGFMTYLHMPEENFPYVQLNFVSITTIHPDIQSPDEIEKQITIPMEEAIDSLEAMKHYRSWSAEGRSVLILETNDSISSIDEFLIRVRDKVNIAKAELPPGTEEPIVDEIQLTLPAIGVAIAGGSSLRRLHYHYDRLHDLIQSVDGVVSLGETGRREREITVQVDPIRLQSYSLSLQDIMNAIQRKNANLPGGSLDTPTGEIRIRTLGEFQSAEEIENVIVRSGDAGQFVYVRDVATVEDGFKKATEYMRVSGQPALGFLVNKSNNGRIIEICNEVKRRVTEFQKTLPPDIQVLTYRDSSHYIRNRLDTMKSNAMIGLVLVFLLLFALTSFGVAFWTAAGIPIALAMTVIIMWYGFGMSINLMTIFGMVMVLGMLVDDGIIVSENIYRYIERGMHPIQAATRGVKEVFWPVCGTIATSIAAFSPLLLMDGVLGKFISFIPKVVVIALVCSLIEAFVVLPGHMAHFSGKPGKRKKSKFMIAVLDVYSYLLKTIIRYRYVAVVMILVSIMATVTYATLWMDFVLFQEYPEDALLITVEASEDSNLDHTDTLIGNVEALIHDIIPANHLLTVTAEVGKKIIDEGYVIGENVGWLFVDLDETNPDSDALAYINELRRAIAELPGIASFEIRSADMGPPVGRPVDLRILGPDLGELVQHSEILLQHMRDIPGVTDLHSSFEAGKREIVVSVHEDRARLLGIDTMLSGMALFRAFEGGVADQLRWGRDEIDIVARLQESYRKTPEDIKEFRVMNPEGTPVILKDIASFTTRPGYHEIYRWNGRRAIRLTADISTDVTTSAAVNLTLQNITEDFSTQHPGYDLDFGGEEEDTKKSMESLGRSFLIAFGLIYTILAGIFRSYLLPIIIIMAVPMSFIGAILGLIASSQPLGFLSIMGGIALSGIVVNDSIVLMDFIEHARSKGMSVHKAILLGGRTRFRPILLTTITTMGGVMTLAFFTTGQEAMLAPMAITIFWGLAFSTVLILLIVPCLYLLLDDFRRNILGTTTSFRRTHELTDLKD